MDEPSPTPFNDTIDSRWRDPEIALLVGLVYFLSILILPPVMDGIGVPRFPRADYLAERGTVHALSIALIALPQIACLFLYLRFAEAKFLKLQLCGESQAVVGVVFLAGFFWFLVLDKLGVLPFTWRTIGNSSLDYARVLLHSKALLGIALLAVAGVVITPILEETVFRFGLIQWTLRRTNSWGLSIAFAAFVFAVAHTTVFTQNNPRLAIDTFVFGVFAGWCVYKRRGRIGIPIALHAAKNATELASLVAAAIVHQ